MITRQFSTVSGTRPYATAAIQGTGVNPVHSIPDSQGGRNIAADGSELLVPQNLIESDWGGPADFGYMYEDQGLSYSAAESPIETGMAERPAWGSDNPTLTRQKTTPGYPGYGPTATGVAKGEAIRSVEMGAIATNTPVDVPFWSGAAGWENKQTDGVIEPGSGISDADQYTRQTSMQQLRRTRAGSQRGNETTGQSPYDAPITTRVPGMKLKIYAGQYRHAQMAPQRQTVRNRVFWNRNAGTGPVAWLNSPNELNTPLDRTPPPDPYQGQSVPFTQANSYGYTGEDGLY